MCNPSSCVVKKGDLLGVTLFICIDWLLAVTLHALVELVLTDNACPTIHAQAGAVACAHLTTKLLQSLTAGQLCKSLHDLSKSHTDILNAGLKGRPQHLTMWGLES